ncbi:unnamed protein product [Caenorhabditis bovis]|nr:unnamed protein product [Caenorhabditis bovis]
MQYSVPPSSSSTTTLICPTPSLDSLRACVSSSSDSAYLPLAPPYHILPNTPYFRNATIIPPPVRDGSNVSILQRIINRYLESMEIHDELQRMEIENMLIFDDEITLKESVEDVKTSLKCPWWHSE